jgi:hypothetical protein
MALKIAVLMLSAFGRQLCTSGFWLQGGKRAFVGLGI